MRQASARLEVATKGKGLIDISREVHAFVARERIGQGLLTVFCRHTSASLLIQENADPDVQEDLKHFLETIAPEGAGYVHDTEGADDMPAHIRAALTQTSLSIPIESSRLVLGTWQGIYLCEHRSAPHKRTIALHVMGE
ncbi:MAG: secondary thiamine-phosphate synthase enzyme YjbQ [Beijerinckiaceae bacterium]|nr:secondary thiamine-phosphate synthase enzyme YjbQ [Beijerinckiaceae bacterium]